MSGRQLKNPIAISWYIVGEDIEQSTNITIPNHLGSSFTVMQRPINRERHALITDTQSNMTMKLIQPKV
jgi:hypothetical protein